MGCQERLAQWWRLAVSARKVCFEFLVTLERDGLFPSTNDSGHCCHIPWRLLGRGYAGLQELSCGGRSMGYVLSHECGVLNSKRSVRIFLSKWHNCRMADYARRLSEMSTLSKAKADNLALHTKLKALSGKLGRGLGEGAVREAAWLSTTVAVPTDAQMQHRSKFSGMPDSRLMSLTKGNLVARIKAAGANICVENVQGSPGH